MTAKTTAASFPLADACCRALFDQAQTVMLLIDPDADGRIVDANAKAVGFYGWPLDVLRTMRIFDINTLPPERVKAEMEKARVEQQNFFDFRHRRADGSIRDVAVHTGPIDLNGRRLLFSIIEDVTEQRAAESVLNLLTQRSLHLLDLPRLADTLDEADFLQRGLEMAEQLTESPISFIHFVNADEETIEFVTWSRRTLETYCTAITDRHYPVGQAGLWADALRRRAPVVCNDYAVAAGRRGLPAGHATLTRLISLPVIEHDKVAMLVGVGNRATPYEQRDVDTLQLIANEVWQLVRRKRYGRHLTGMLEEQRQLNRRLEEAQNQLLQSEKMASIGQLAAGVAHEMNNPIGFVHSNLGTLEQYLKDIFEIADAYAEAEAAYGSECPPLERAHRLKADKEYEFLREDIFALLEESREGLTRVARIVRDLKDFSRAGETALQWADLHAGLDSTLNIVWNELKYKCEVKKEYGDLPRIWCAPSQLNQVFMNLLVNAGHAIRDKGTITLRTGHVGAEVFVAVGDNGTGIAPEHLKRIFDPFFTTKPVGKGTGLGLSLAYGIVQKHRGRIEVDSTVGVGTTFTVWLPVEPPADEPAVPPAPTFRGDTP